MDLSPTRRLLLAFKRYPAFHCGAKVARAGNRVYDIGRAVEREVRESGFTVIKQVCGHGVGRTIHEEP
jgi:methionyl aminopeptidase